MTFAWAVSVHWMRSRNGQWWTLALAYSSLVMQKVANNATNHPNQEMGNNPFPFKISLINCIFIGVGHIKNEHYRLAKKPA